MADVLTVRNELRLQNWMEMIRECQESGLTNKEFCVQRGISEKTYYYWLRKIRSTAVEPHLARLDDNTGRTFMDIIQLRYGEAELKLYEDVGLKAVMVLLNALRCHD